MRNPMRRGTAAMISEPSPSRALQPLGPAQFGLPQGAAQRLLWALALAVLAVVAFDQVQRALEFRVDDAYITFSFSKNLGTGHGPVFSHGLRVEGYSNFLWMVVVAVRYLFTAEGDPLNFARVVAFGCRNC